MNLKAFDGVNPLPIFGCTVKTKDEARKAVLNSPYLVRVHHIEFKFKKYHLSDVYAGRMDSKHQMK